MTEEEAKKKLEEMQEYYCFNESELDALDVAIQVLEQESVLDKIKAEIKELSKEPAYYIPNYDAYKKALDIIEKYKAESETKEQMIVNKYRQSVDAFSRTKEQSQKIVSNKDVGKMGKILLDSVLKNTNSTTIIEAHKKSEG